MGDLPGKFPGRRASEDKARRKDPCWPVGTVVESDKQPLQNYSLVCLKIRRRVYKHIKEAS